jgi:hypothetical protein
MLAGTAKAAVVKQADSQSAAFSDKPSSLDLAWVFMLIVM